MGMLTVEQTTKVSDDRSTQVYCSFKDETQIEEENKIDIFSSRFRTRCTYLFPIKIQSRGSRMLLIVWRLLKRLYIGIITGRGLNKVERDVERLLSSLDRVILNDQDIGAMLSLGAHRSNSYGFIQ